MFLDEFHKAEGNTVRISAQQASRFAKEIADDFNPIHNPDAQRFCVPGDLLFSLVLAKYGISPKMTFIFKGMVGDNDPLDFTPTDANAFDISNGADKVYLRVEREGEILKKPALAETLSRNYVAFSGHNYPYTIQPLLTSQQVMLNPERPLVIYERMLFELDTLDLENPTLEAKQAELVVNGKRGEVNLNFAIKSVGKIVGHGFKRLLVSGLIPHNDEVAEKLVATYLGLKASYRL
ncbi:DUF3581 family protein [uncultured Thiothrix sp.]|uniref:DUF3581 family protein n=1 Tax=uncultured Thiothrix sp. TaxID=223185 RepID=UPI00260A8A38|nr:DUF3581 family protein [uncultured Thiothrix sp.]HMT93956.1 DUF3581 family protein [Thiolinea sp.]